MDNMAKNIKKSKWRSRIELVVLWILFILGSYFLYHDLFAKVQIHNEVLGTDIQVDVTFAVPLTVIAGFFLLSSVFMRWEKAAESVVYELYFVCCVLLACFPVPWMIHRFYEENGPALSAGCCENPALYPLFFSIVVFLVAIDSIRKGYKHEETA